MVPYLIRQGDYVAALGARLGFDARSVWLHERNAVLRAKRGSPNILAPGDVLYIPEARHKPAPLLAHTANCYRASVPKARIVVGLRGRGADWHVANEPYELRGLGGEVIHGTTDAEGRLVLSLPIHIACVDVTFPRLGVRMPLQVGHLDPVDTISGVEQRLEHLGYDARNLPEALRAFQRDMQLPETGAVDAATTAALASKHGI